MTETLRNKDNFNLFKIIVKKTGQNLRLNLSCIVSFICCLIYHGTL